MAAKGSVRLAAILQKRMGKVKDFGYSPTAELGTITAKGLILDSFPKDVMGKDEYAVCNFDTAEAAGGQKNILEDNDRVGVLGADGSRVVIEKMSKVCRDEHNTRIEM